MQCSMIYLLSSSSSSSSFRRIFWKRTFFEGVPAWELWVSFAQKLYLGVKNMCKKFQKVVTLGWDLLRVTVLTTPPNRAIALWIALLVEWCYHIYSMVKTTWTSWMDFGPVEWDGWGLVVIESRRLISTAQGKKGHFRWIIKISKEFDKSLASTHGLPPRLNCILP